MIIQHKFSNVEKSTSDNKNIRIILFNRKGGYFLQELSGLEMSKYDGMFIMDEHNNIYKVLESLSSKNNIKVVENYGYKIVLKGDFNETFLMPNNFNSLIYKSDKVHEINLFFDIRKNYDFRNFGRYYEVWEEYYNNEKLIVLKFDKKTSSKEDSTNDVKEYEIYVVIKTDGPCELKREWVKREYLFDKKRNSSYDRYVFKALKTDSSRIVISCGFNKKKTMQEANFVFKSLDSFEDREKKFFKDQLKELEFDNLKLSDEEKAALISSINSIRGLCVKNSIIAGFPWFFQNWTRDELISLDTFIKLKEYELVKKIILKNLVKVSSDGLLRTNDKSELKSADSVGILFKRIEDFLNCLESEGKINKILTMIEKKLITKKVELITKSIIKNFYDKKLHLVSNNNYETWMDSLRRNGFKIEIQALMIKILELTYKLTGNRSYLKIRSEIIKNTRKMFLKKGVLIDGLYYDKGRVVFDNTIRNNIFLAYYYYPKLLSKKEWQVCFEKALKKLWNPWGGISSVDKKSKFFVKKHTGEIPKSYHNGDSWYFINNIAALAMMQVNKKRFKQYIRKIIRASVFDNLYSGVIGSSSELSSSQEMKSEGCLVQAWSNSTLIEVLMEKNKKSLN